MTWEVHQHHGLFGFTDGQAGRWTEAQVDLKEAFEESADVRAAFFAWVQWQDAPPFSGGVLTDWPARMVDGLAFARREWAAVNAHLAHEARKKAANGGSQAQHHG